MIAFEPFNSAQDRVYRTYENGNRVMIGYIGKDDSDLPFCAIVQFNRFTDEEQQACLREIFRQRGERRVSIPVALPPEKPSVTKLDDDTYRLILP